MSATVTRTHSTWLHLVKSPRYFAAVDEVREASGPSVWGKGSHGSTAQRKGDAYPEHDRLPVPGLGDRWNAKEVTYNPLGKLPGSVWTITEQEVVERIVTGWSPKGGVVIDPFSTTRPR